MKEVKKSSVEKINIQIYMLIVYNKAFSMNISDHEAGFSTEGKLHLQI